MHHESAEYGDRWAGIYDEEHEWRDPGPSVEFLTALAGDKRVLELGVGTGRIAIPLAERGVDIVGLDASSAMVEKMRAKPSGRDLEVLLGDMAATDLRGPYGLVFVAFNTIFGLGDQRRQLECFRNVRRALEGGGRFVLECFVPDLRRFQDGDQAVRVLPTSSSDRLRLDATLHFPEQQRIDSYVMIVAGGTVRVVPVSLRYIWPAELDLMGELAGFELEARYGGWSEEPFTRESSAHVSVYRTAEAG